MGKLEDVKNDYLTGEMFGKQWCSTPKTNFDWLMERAKKAEMLEKQWYLLKIELEQRRDFEERCNSENEIDLIDDIDSIMQKLESGEYFK